MATDLKIDIAAEFVGKKAFKQADTAVDKLTGSVKKLAGGLGLALGTRQLAIYSKNAVKAFAEDQKAAKALTLTLNNLGMAFADPAVKSFISDIEAQYGIVDDLLRPAYQKLVTTTGDYLKAQDLLKTALDLSAMSGADVVSVSADLAKAYAGNTRGLIKYGLGLSKTEIQAMSFEEILARIAEVSKGQAEAAADSYAGALGRLQVATQNASESLGKDLITALSTLGGEGGLPKTLSLIESIASAIGDATIGISRLIRNIGILASGNPIQSIRDLRAATAADKAIDRRDRAVYGGIYATQYQAQAAKSSKMSPIAAAQAKATKALTKATQDQLKLAKAKAIFDLQKIQIEAALKGKISEEDRIRLKLMQAIEDENISQIEKYTKLLDEAQKKTKELTDALQGIKPMDDIFKNWNFMSVKEQLASLQTYFANFAGSAASALNALSSAQQAALGGYKPFVGASIPSVAGANSNMVSTVGLGTSGTGNQLPAGVTINTTVQGSVIAQNDLNQAINDALAASGWAGSAIGYSRQAAITAI